MSLLAKLFKKRNKKKMMEAKLVLLGSSGAGKTTFVKYLESGSPVEEDPRTTLGIDIRANPVKIENWEFSVIDVGGQTLYQKTFWSLGVGQADAIVYIVDGTVRPSADSFTASHQQFQYMLNLVESELPLLILINKQDLAGQNPMTVEEASQAYGIGELVGRSMSLLPTSAKYGEGVEVAMQWIIEKLDSFS